RASMFRFPCRKRSFPRRRRSRALGAETMELGMDGNAPEFDKVEWDPLNSKWAWFPRQPAPRVIHFTPQPPSPRMAAGAVATILARRGDGMVEVKVVAGERRFVQEIEVGKHRLIGDEPIEKGGTDAGPNPYGFLLAALGSCTSATVRMVAD